VAQADHPSQAIGGMLPGYFSTLHIPIRAGRGVTPRDTAGISRSRRSILPVRFLSAPNPWSDEHGASRKDFGGYV